MDEPNAQGLVWALLGGPPPGDKPHADRVLVPATSLTAAKELDDSSGKRHATPVRKSFVRASVDPTGSEAGSDAEAPPLSRLLRVGGRGGGVAIKLYLALLWRCSGSPYRTSKPARAWATLLGLEDPAGKGARRINEALKTLQNLNLVQVEYTAGQGNTVILLDESGDGSHYQPPSTAYARAPIGPAGDAQRQRNTYFKVPSQWWVEGDVQSLTGPGLTMLLILLAEQLGEGKDVWFSTDTFPQRYRISHKTRAAGTRELTARRLIRLERQALPDIPGVFNRLRYRNVYHLVPHGTLTAQQQPTDHDTNPASPAVDQFTSATPLATIRRRRKAG